MNATAVSKSRALNFFEGMTLTAIFQALPTFAGTVLLLKLAGDHQILNDRYGAAIFVTFASVFYALTMPYLGPKFPRFFQNSYEPLFFDASLSFREKLAQWRAKSATSLQLVTMVMMLSLLAVAVVSVG
jgi:hypothetical protein